LGSQRQPGAQHRRALGRCLRSSGPFPESVLDVALCERWLGET
jgi:hypothetical protein